MKFFEYEYETFDGEKKTLKLRLTTGDMKIIESKTDKSLLEYVSALNATMLSNLLMYMSRTAITNFSSKDADKLMDELIDSGLTLEEIYINIIMETLVISGFMKKEQLNKIKEENNKEQTPSE